MRSGVAIGMAAAHANGSRILQRWVRNKPKRCGLDLIFRPLNKKGNEGVVEDHGLYMGREVGKQLKVAIYNYCP